MINTVGRIGAINSYFRISNTLESQRSGQSLPGDKVRDDTMHPCYYRGNRCAIVDVFEQII